METALSKEQHSLALRQLKELLTLRLERYKDRLIDSSDDVVRGQARELKQLLKLM